MLFSLFLKDSMCQVHLSSVDSLGQPVKCSHMLTLLTQFYLLALRLDHQHCGHHFGSSLWAGKHLCSPRSWVCWLVCKASLCLRREREVPCSVLGPGRQRGPCSQRACGPAKARPAGEASLRLMALGSWGVTENSISPTCPL